MERRPLNCPSPATIAECGGSCEQGFWHCDCGLLEKLNPELRGPAPASSLLERVVMAIGRDGETARWNEARAAIREVAAWLRERHGGHLVAATVLEREAER